MRDGREREVSVAVFDVDDLTATNDAAGHEAGDDVLRSVAAVVAGAVRLVDIGRPTRRRRVHRRRTRIGRDRPWPDRVLEGVAELPESAGRRISVSAGVARFPVDGTDAESIVGRPGPPQRAPAPRAAAHWRRRSG